MLDHIAMSWCVNSNRRSLINVILWPLLIACCLLDGHQVVLGLRRSMRSVQRCDLKSAFVATFSQAGECQTHCQETYIRVNHDILIANEEMSQAYLRETRDGRECCCVFEAPWPSFVQTQWIGRETTKVSRKPSDCLPLLMAFNLSKRTKQSYEVLCKYYAKQEPLTMLELMRFAEAATYLNYMQPKHPSIRHVLKNKPISRVQKQEMDELRAVFYTDLLDIYLPLEFYDGYKLSTKRLRRFLELKRDLSSALKSDIVARAYDELIISNMLVDVTAAAQYLTELSINQLHVPVELLNGDYDKYDHDLATYFTLSNVDCKLLTDTLNRLQTYVSVLKSLSISLTEKLIYEHMSEKYDKLVSVLEIQKVYMNLKTVNCQMRRG